MTEWEKWEYLQDEARYELERLCRDEQDDLQDFEEWSAAQADYLKSLGVSHGYSNDD